MFALYNHLLSEVSMFREKEMTRPAFPRGRVALSGMALGATALGAFAIGAVAIGALVIRKVAIRSGRIERLSIGELVVDRL
jgi:hypothetical protein